MGDFRLRYSTLIVALLLCLPLRAADSQTSSVPLISSSARTLIPATSQSPAFLSTPSGSYLSYNGATFFLPGVQLSRFLQTSLMLAGSDVVYRKLMHYFLQMILEHSAHNWGVNFLFGAVYGALPYTLGIWNLFTNLIPKAQKLFNHGKERTTTALGWSRRGRMPVYAGGELDQAVFIDFLIRTQEGSDQQLQQLEITPLHKISLNTLSSTWQRAMGQLVNAALDNQVDIIRITAKESGEMQLEWHQAAGSDGGKWSTSDTFYPPLESDESYLTQWLEHSWQTPPPAGGLFTVLEPAALNCISQRFTDRYAICSPLTGLVAVDEQPDTTFALMSRGENSQNTYFHISNSHSLSPGLPGHLVISEYPALAEQDYSLSSGQYRMPRELTYLAEYIAYQLAYQLLDRTLGEGIETLNAAWHQKSQYKTLTALQGTRIPGSVQRVTGPDGTVYIKKQAPLTTWLPGPNRTRYALLTREAAILKQLAGEGSIKVHDTWLDNAGSDNAQLVMLVENGGRDLTSVRPQRMAEFKQLVRGATEAVERLHSAGYAHFDIKPENFVVNGQGEVRLIDLEMAAPLNSGGVAVPLTFDYRWKSPEITMLQPTTWRADIWNLGATALSLFSNSALPAARGLPSNITGNKVFGTPSLADHATAILENQNLLGTTPGFADFLKQSLNPDPDQRLPAAALKEHVFLQ